MRSRRTAHDEVAEVARRRLELLSAELAGVRASVRAGLPAEEERPRAVPEPGREPWSATEPEREPWNAPPPTATPAMAPSPAPAGPRAMSVPTPAAAPSASTGSDEPAPIPAPAATPAATPAPTPAVTGTGRGRHARRPVGGATRAAGWLHDRLPATLQGRVALSSAHLTVVALLVAGAFGVSAWWVMRADGGDTLVPSALTAPTSTPAGGLRAEQVGAEETALAGRGTPAPTSSGVPGQGASAGTEVVVDVAGKVRRPGIVTLPLGSRVVDALRAAGGARRGVDLTPLNLARLLVDGEQIVVGVAPPPGVAASAASSPGAPQGGPLVNINQASQAELEELPGVGPVTAAAILQWRTDNGAFTAVDELLEVSGIGEATLAEMAPFVTL